MAEDPSVFSPGPRERALGAARGTRIGPQAGAVELGCTLYESTPADLAMP